MANLQDLIQNIIGRLNSQMYRTPLRIFNHSNYQRFIILSRSRTGSNLLVSFLNSHPNIVTKGEIFVNLNKRNYNEILSEVFSPQPYSVKAVGFKIFYYHPLDDNSGGIWDYLINQKNLRVIHLKRRNILRTLISRKIAEIQDVWTITDPASPNNNKQKSVSFTVNELERMFIQTREWETRGDKMFRDHKLLTIYYEDMIAYPEDNFRRLADLFAVPYTSPKTNLVKQNPEKISDLLINFEELKSAFVGTEWQEFFED
jgi:LPS sulfotransferase NodH